MQKNVRSVIDLAQFLRRNEARQHDAISDLQFAGQLLKLIEHRTFAGNRQRRARIMRQKSGESVQRCRDSFFLDEPTRLEKMPLAIFQKLRKKWVAGLGTMSILSNGNFSAFSRFCAMTIGATRPSPVICR